MRKRISSSSLFLLELILAILIFSIAAAICVSFFVKAHQMSRDSGNLNQAVNEAGSMAELIRGSDTAETLAENVTAIYPDAEIAAGTASDQTKTNDTVTVTHPIALDDQNSGILQVSMTVSDSGILQARIECSPSSGQTEEPIYTLDVEHVLSDRPSASALQEAFVKEAAG